VITVSAAQDFTAGKLAVAFSYAIGFRRRALPAAARRAAIRPAPAADPGPRFQMAMGAVMVIIAVAMTANLDTRFQTAVGERPSRVPGESDGRPSRAAPQIATNLASVRPERQSR